MATASPAGPLLDIAYVRALDERPTLVSGVPARLPEAVASATYDASGQLRTWGERTFTYDPLGNELSDGIRTLTWDSRGQLTQVGGPIVAAYGYDAFGRRVATRVDGVGSDAVFDIQNVVRIVPADGSPTDVLGGLNLISILATSSDGSTSAVLRDDLDTVLGLVGAAGLRRRSPCMSRTAAWMAGLLTAPPGSDTSAGPRTLPASSTCVPGSTIPRSVVS